MDGRDTEASCREAVRFHHVVWGKSEIGEGVPTIMNHNLDVQRRPSLRTLIRRLVIEERGQDLVEYALIACFFGIVGLLVMQAIQVAIGDTYSDWLDPAVGTPSLWDPAEPSGS